MLLGGKSLGSARGLAALSSQPVLRMYITPLITSAADSDAPFAAAGLAIRRDHGGSICAHSASGHDRAPFAGQIG